MKKEQYKVLKRLCNKFEYIDRRNKSTYTLKDGSRFLIKEHEEKRKNYKVFKSLCNKYEHEQRKLKEQVNFILFNYGLYE